MNDRHSSKLQKGNDSKWKEIYCSRNYKTHLEADSSNSYKSMIGNNMRCNNLEANNSSRYKSMIGKICIVAVIIKLDYYGLIANKIGFWEFFN